MKIYELKIKDMESVNLLTEALLLNGYAIKSRVKFKEFPREESVDYFLVEIYDPSTEKGGVKE